MRHVVDFTNVSTQGDMMIASRPLEVSDFEVDGLHVSYVFYDSGLAINVVYSIDPAIKTRRRLHTVRRHGRPRGTRIEARVRAPEVETRRHHPRVVLRHQG